MQRQAALHARILRPKLAAEIEAFLVVRPTRCQLAANREIAAPCRPAMDHRDFQFFRQWQREEDARRLVQLRKQCRHDAVTVCVEEAVRAAGGADRLGGSRARSRVAPQQGRHVDYGKLGFHCQVAMLTINTPVSRT